MEVFLLYYSIFCALLLVISLKMLKRLSHQRRNLPPGSMGWPIVGETLQLFSQNPAVFFATRAKRYGETFKTHILRCPCVVLVNPEAIRYVLVTQANLFKPAYPPSKEKLIGPWALFFHEGEYHACVRKLVQASLSINMIRNLVPDIEAVANFTLDSFSDGKLVNTFREMKKFTFDVAVLSIFGHLETRYKDMLVNNYYTLDKGYNSFLTKIPGSSYTKSVMARRRLGQILSEIIKERKDKRIVDDQKGLLDRLINFKGEDGELLTDDQITDNIIGVFFAAQDTTASLLTWILKYIHDDLTLLEDIKKEHRAIYIANDGGKGGLTWAQIRNMPLTNRVIMESLRKASIISFTYREAVDDVEYNGYLIPKGWKVLPSFRNVHHNPDFFNDPDVFNPSRFQAAPKPNTFMPFGNGVHACPGNEVAKVEILILIHHLINKFRWEVLGSKNGVQYNPFPIPRNGLPAKFWKEPWKPSSSDACG